MSDPDSNPTIPSWQKSQSDETDSQTTEPVLTPSTSTSTSEVDAPAAVTASEETAQPENATDDKPDDQDKLEVARRFLENDAVRDAPYEKKVEFLKSKGIDEAGIQELLGQDDSTTQDEVRVLFTLMQSQILIDIAIRQFRNNHLQCTNTYRNSSPITSFPTNTRPPSNCNIPRIPRQSPPPSSTCHERAPFQCPLCCDRSLYSCLRYKSLRHPAHG
jgi:hypothetical protein